MRNQEGRGRLRPPLTEDGTCREHACCFRGVGREHQDMNLLPNFFVLFLRVWPFSIQVLEVPSLQIKVYGSKTHVPREFLHSLLGLIG